MLASETVTSHQDGPLNQIPDKAASKPGAGLASHKSERATMEAFPKIRNQCSVAVNIECKKEKYKNKGKKTRKRRIFFCDGRPTIDKPAPENWV